MQLIKCLSLACLVAALPLGCTRLARNQAESLSPKAKDEISRRISSMLDKRGITYRGATAVSFSWHGGMRVDLSMSNIQDVKALAGIPIEGLLILEATSNITDIAELKCAKNLYALDLSFSSITNLPVFSSCRLFTVEADHSALKDISGLRGAEVDSLLFWSTPITDLAPLSEASVEVLIIDDTGVKDLEPLRTCKNLDSLECANTDVDDLAPLKDTSITTLNITGTPVSDLSPLRGMSLISLRMRDTRVTDLSPLKGMPLKIIEVDVKKITNGLDVLKDMPLKDINEMEASEFWEWIGNIK